jgi:hypothetical protein
MSTLTHMPPPLFYDNDSPRARQSDPVTSHRAADGNNVSGSREVVLRVLRIYGPLADHELVARHHWEVVGTLLPKYTEQRLRTARAELVESGFVQFTGEYRMTASNRRTQVWSLG